MKKILYITKLDTGFVELIFLPLPAALHESEQGRIPTSSEQCPFCCIFYSGHRIKTQMDLLFTRGQLQSVYFY